MSAARSGIAETVFSSIRASAYSALCARECLCFRGRSATGACASSPIGGLAGTAGLVRLPVEGCIVLHQDTPFDTESARQTPPASTLQERFAECDEDQNSHERSGPSKEEQTAELLDSSLGLVQ